MRSESQTDPWVPSHPWNSAIPHQETPEVMPECYVPRNLTAEQLAHLYAQAKERAEAEVASAWMNCVQAPNDPVRQSVYAKARLALADLEADERRVLGGG